jgi:uncharacterized protein YjiK
VAGLTLGAGGCASAQQGAPLADRYDLSRRGWRLDLPGRLDEISGLAFTRDGRLFTHADERAHVFEVDLVRRAVGKRIEVGNETVRDDFEGIAVVGDRFFLVSSRGLLYEFREVADEEESPYRVTDLFEDVPRCEVEGLDFDPLEEALLLACKRPADPRDAIVVHLIPMDAGRDRPPPVRVAREALRAWGVEAVSPSGVAVDPTQGTFVLVAAREEVLVEVGRDGRVLAVTPLSKERHAQTEGIAFGPDGTLYLADERNDHGARLTAYSPRSPSIEP